MRGRRRRKRLLRMVLKLTPKRATTTLKRTTARKQKVVTFPQRPPLFTPKIPVNIVRILKCTEHWSWSVLTAFGTITTRFVRYAITRSPRREFTSKRAFFGVTIVANCGAITRKKAKTLETNFIFLLNRKTKKRINFSFLSNRCVFDSFCHWFSIKFLKRYLVSGLIVSVY